MNAAKPDRLVQVYPPEVAAARAAYRERRRKVHEDWFRPPTPQEDREQRRRDALNAIGCLMSIPAVAALAGVPVMVAGEALPVALVATVAGTITGWLMAGLKFLAAMVARLVIYYRAQKEFRGVWERRSLGLVVYEWVAAYLPYAAAVGVTLLVSRIL